MRERERERERERDVPRQLEHFREILEAVASRQTVSRFKLNSRDAGAIQSKLIGNVSFNGIAISPSRVKNAGGSGERRGAGVRHPRLAELLSATSSASPNS